MRMPGIIRASLPPSRGQPTGSRLTSAGSLASGDEGRNQTVTAKVTGISVTQTRLTVSQRRDKLAICGLRSPLLFEVTEAALVESVVESVDDRFKEHLRPRW